MFKALFCALSFALKRYSMVVFCDPPTAGQCQFLPVSYLKIPCSPRTVIYPSGMFGYRTQCRDIVHGIKFRMAYIESRFGTTVCLFQDDVKFISRPTPPPSCSPSPIIRLMNGGFGSVKINLGFEFFNFNFVRWVCP